MQEARTVTSFDAQKNFHLPNMLFAEMQKYMSAYKCGAYSENKRGKMRSAYKIEKAPSAGMIDECFGFKFSLDSAQIR